MSVRHALLGLLLVASLLIGSSCSQLWSPSHPPENPLPDPIVDELEPTGSGQLLPHDQGADEGLRHRRRMDLDQLSQALAQVSGGLVWLDEEGEDMFELLGPTLGKPDYRDITTEDLSPSMLFQKFLGRPGGRTRALGEGGSRSHIRE